MCCVLYSIYVCIAVCTILRVLYCPLDQLLTCVSNNSSCTLRHNMHYSLVPSTIVVKATFSHFSDSIKPYSFDTLSQIVCWMGSSRDSELSTVEPL